MTPANLVKEYNCRTTAIELLNEQVYRIRFQLIDGINIEFKGGQYIILHMPDGKRVPLSIASAPEEKRFIELHVRLVEGHTLAEEMIAIFKDSNTFRIDAPCGGCYLNNSDKDIIIIAGGTGFSPMKSLVESALLQQSNRKIQLYLGAQIVNDLYQHELILSWAKNNDNFSYAPVISGEDSSWQGATGFPHELAIQNNEHNLTNKDFYISGSGPMVMAVYEELLARNVDKNQIHSDILNIKRESGEID